MSDQLIELEVEEADDQLSRGLLTIECFGSENTYYMDANEQRYFCKNYPTLD